LIFILGIQKENYNRFCAEFSNAMSTTDVQNTNAVAVKTHRYRNLGNGKIKVGR
jgi:hypothetical protein